MTACPEQELARGGLGFWRYAATYAPLRGPFAGTPGPDSQALTTFDTDFGVEYYLRGAAGTEASFDFTLSNSGRFAVTVTKLDFPFTRSVEWSPSSHDRGLPDPSQPRRALPATIPARGTIVLQLTLVKPGCDGGTALAGTATVHWNALGVHHLYFVEPFIGGTFAACSQHAPAGSS